MKRSATPTMISQAWACLRTNIFVHRFRARTNTHAHLMASLRCIVVSLAQFASMRTLPCKWPKRLMESASSFRALRTTSLLQSAYSDHQIGSFENFHQLVQDTLVVLRSGLKVFFQYALRFPNRLKRQLLISHRFPPITQLATH
jgi:hypothetical protein